MNHLFIIGNGFDLAHGLKTKYEQFLLWYLNNAHIKVNETKDYSDDLLMDKTEHDHPNHKHLATR